LKMGTMKDPDDDSSPLADRKGEGPKFYSEEDPMIYPVRVVDGNLESRFEYETCNFPHSVGVNMGSVDTDLFDPTDLDMDLGDLPVANSKTANNIDEGTPLYGTKFKDGTVWSVDPENNTLKLHIQIDIGSREIINWLDIIPYNIPYDGFEIPALTSMKTAEEKGGELEPVDLTLGIVGTDPSQADINNDVDVSDRYEQIALASERKQTIDNVENIYKEPISDRITVTFSPRKVRIIDLVFEQSIPYDCPIGHIFWERKVIIETTETSWFGLKEDKSRETKRERIAGERMDYSNITAESGLSLGEVVLSGLGGAAAGAATGIAAGAAMGASLGPAGALVGGVLGAISGLWGGTEKDILSDEIETGIDVFDGWRYAISLSNISSGGYEYVEESKIISEEYKLPNEAEEIELDVNEQIPN
ncbi:MAG: hypothetical protein ACOCRO_06690, partial [Halanaerobiales bacterium]